MLIHEHKVILKVIAKCSTLIEQLSHGASVDSTLLARIVEFMQQYADKSHHGKEEDLLFPAFEKAGVPSYGCPLAALRFEHKEGRRLVAMLKKALQPTRKAVIIKALIEIVDLYPNHIWKEEFLLFPLSKRLLSPKTREDLANAFELVDERFGCEAYKAYETFARKASFSMTNRLRDTLLDLG
jgi:hemerythrin-like domain-containing protein